MHMNASEDTTYPAEGSNATGPKILGDGLPSRRGDTGFNLQGFQVRR